jgi:hypothetical protein
MKILFGSITLFILVGSTMALAGPHDPSIAELQSAPQTIATPYNVSIQFPRDYTPRYRGQESELFSLDSALRAFFEDETATIESLEYSSISLILQDKWWPTLSEDKNKMFRMRKYFCKNWETKKKSKNIQNKYCHNLYKTYVSKGINLHDTIEKLLTKKSKYSQREANLLTQNILKKKFSYESNRVKRNRLLDYNSHSYQDFPADVLFSTVFQQNAMIYGDTVIVIAPNDNRSLDLSYYNGINNMKWGFAADAGEYITPGYIKAKEISGIHLRQRGEYPDKIRNQVRINTYEVQKHFPIKYAFYKISHQGKVYVLVFDGKRGSRDTYCIKRSSNHFNHCRWADPMHNNGIEMLLAGNQPLGKVQSYVPNLIGVLSLHQVGTISQRPDKLISRFKYYSDESLDQSMKNSAGIGEQSPLQTINAFKMKINKKNHKLKFFKANQ